MARTVIIGYGNPLRGDDGLGWHAAERLRDDLAGPDVEVIACQQLTPELAEIISRAERAVFIDACHGAYPGTISCQPVKIAAAQARSFSHDLDPAALLAGAQVLYGAAPTECVVMSISGASFAHGQALSPVVAAALPLLVDRACAFAIHGFASPEQRSNTVPDEAGQ